jgi:hypothetical protein
MFTVLLVENLDPDAPLHERFLRRYRDTCAIIGSGIRRGQRAGRFRADVDPRVKAKEVVAFLYGIETSWLLDRSVPRGRGLRRVHAVPGGSSTAQGVSPACSR